MTKNITMMKTKKFFLLLAAVLLGSVSAMAQSGNNNPQNGDVNGDGVVDIADVAAVLGIMKGGGGTATVGDSKYYYYVGRQDIKNGGIGTVDWENTNTSAFLASSDKISANSIAEIKSALNGTVSVGASGEGKEEIIIVVPTEVANAITSIKTPADKTIIYDKLKAVNGYTCIFIGEMSWSEIKISFS